MGDMSCRQLLPLSEAREVVSRRPSVIFTRSEDQALVSVFKTEGLEAKFIRDIVNVIRKKRNYNILYIKDKLVGMKEDVTEIESWLQDASPNSTILLIDGMGGIGKTTIAKYIFNSNCHEYDGSCFLKNINEISNQHNGLLRLQSQLLSTIFKSQKEETIWNEDEGTTKIINAICNKKVLLVLDDVATLQQLDALLGPQTFYSGSKVIITTRHTWLLTSFKVPPKVKTIRTLSYDDSVELFSLYSFPQGQPIEPYYDQSEKISQVIRYCEGLPLALEVLASNLRGKSIVEWKDAMCKLEKNPFPGIQKVLQLSYESLEDDNDKNVFLHIACFFVQEDKDYIVKVLAECNLYPIIGIKNLIDRSLLHVVNGKVGMHQLIREMGQEVVRLESPNRLESPKYPGKRSRLWQHEDCINVLQGNVGSKRVEGFRLDMQKRRVPKLLSAMNMENPRKRSFEEYLAKTVQGNVANFKIRSLEKMTNLMLLQLSYITISGKYKKFPKNLRLLSWHGFCLKSIPGDIPLEKLVVLDMCYSNLERVWDNFKFIESLKILNLSYSVELIKTPDFGGLPALESLILKGCISLTEIGDSITNLKELVLIDLSDCRNLRSIPCLPRSLVSIQMSGCPNLGAVGGFRCLDSISLPSVLMKLDISNCNLYDNSFPNNWSNLVSLKELRIDGNNVTCLPKCVQSLPRLKHFDANNCSQIQSILGLPKSVSKMRIKDNMSLEKIQVPLEKIIYVYGEGCPNLCYMAGVYKWQSKNKVERKVRQNLGLGMELGLNCKQKVLFEYGIFSTCVREEQIPPSSFYTYKERGPQISFIVPSFHHPNRIISGFNLCVVVSRQYRWYWLRIEVYNKTKDLSWNYYPGKLGNTKEEKKGWLSVWRCGNLLEDGDEIRVRILYGYALEEVVCREVEECGVNLIYDEQDGERKEASYHVVSASDDQIKWSDRMLTNISNFVYTGKTYSFGYARLMNYDSGFDGGSYGKFCLERRGEMAAANR